MSINRAITRLFLLDAIKSFLPLLDTIVEIIVTFLWIPILE